MPVADASPPDQKPARRVGRPRAVNRPLEREPVEEILHQAGIIFAAKGFDATTTREIAEAAGLRPASIFHYFPKKVDILVELSRQILRPHLEVAHAARQVDGRTVAARLHDLMYQEVLLRLREPFDLLPVMLQQDLRSDRRFDEFRADLLDYNTAFQELVAEGQESGEFQPCDPWIAARAVIGMLMWISFWYRAGSRSPEVVASEIAARAVASVAAR